MKLHKWLSVAGKMARHLKTGATQSWGPEFRFNNLYSKLGILFMTVSPAPRQGRQEDQAEAHWHQPSQENASLRFRGRHCLKGIDGVSENTQCLAENTQCFLLASSGHLSHVKLSSLTCCTTLNTSAPHLTGNLPWSFGSKRPWLLSAVD